MSAFEILAVIAAIAYVIGRQLVGEKVAGKRLVLLPAVLAVIGVVDLGGHGHTPGAADIAMIVLGAAIAAGVGLVQGRALHLEARDGVLWGRMPGRSVVLWLGLVVSHVVLAVIAGGIGAHVAAGTAPLLLTLGVNRLAQAAVVVTRAWHAGIPLAPEKDGSTFLAGVITHAPAASTTSSRPTYTSSPTYTSRMADSWAGGRQSRRADRRNRRRR